MLMVVKFNFSNFTQRLKITHPPFGTHQEHPA